MLNPSYSSLIRIINEDNSLDNKITSRYSIVIAAAKRARQIVGGAHYETCDDIRSDKAVSIAVSEMQRRQLRIVPMEDDYEPQAIASSLPSIMETHFDVMASSIEAPVYDEDAEFEGTADEAAAYDGEADVDDGYENYEDDDYAYEDDDTDEVDDEDDYN